MDGHPARGGYRSAARAAESGGDGVVYDLDRPDALVSALGGVDAMFLVGAMGPDQTVVRTASAGPRP